MLSLKTAAPLCAAFVLLSVPARANMAQNGSFEDTGSQTHSFSINWNATLPDWKVNPGPTKYVLLDCLIVSTDTTKLCGNENGEAGWTLKFWKNPGPSPDGGNFVGLDGVSQYANPFTQRLNGLTPGAAYSVSFYQAAAQQYGYDGATTEQWEVKLGSSVRYSTLMDNANHGDVGWMKQTVTFTAANAMQTLQFIALGTPNGQPPFVLLDGVDVELATPEPAAFGLMAIGLSLIIFGRLKLKRRS